MVDHSAVSRGMASLACLGCVPCLAGEAKGKPE